MKPDKDRTPDCKCWILNQVTGIISYRYDQMYMFPVFNHEWKHCPFCGKELKIIKERNTSEENM